MIPIKRRKTSQKTPDRELVQPLTLNFGSIGSAGNVYDITNNIPLGNDLYQRVGRLIQLSEIEIHGDLFGGQSNLGTDDNRNVVRILILITNGLTTAANLSNINAYVRPWHIDGVVSVLYQGRFVLRSSARDSVGYMPAGQLVHIVRKTRQQITYSPLTSNYHLLVHMISDSAIAPNPGFVSGYFRLRFCNL